MGLSISASQTALDTLFPTSANGTYLGYSVNGTSEFAGLARTAVGATGWSAATSADPSVKANSTALTSAALSSGGTISHVAVFSAVTAGTQLTDWQAVGTAKTLGVGDNVTIAISAVQITLT